VTSKVITRKTLLSPDNFIVFLVSFVATLNSNLLTIILMLCVALSNFQCKIYNCTYRQNNLYSAFKKLLPFNTGIWFSCKWAGWLKSEPDPTTIRELRP